MHLWRFVALAIVCHAFTGERDPLCGSIIPTSLHFSGGHDNQECFYRKPVPFEICRVLLQRTQRCNALTYTDNVCSLHDRRKTMHVQKSPRDAVVLVKMTSGIDDCSGADRFLSELDKFSICNSKKRNQSIDHLPVLGIVVAVTESYYKENAFEIDLISGNWQCYASLHQYKFVCNIMMI